MAKATKSATKNRGKKSTRAQGELRIIGGRWRGRKLRFTAEEGLRPTSDRIRETLFNWLAPDIHDARCVDLFAGSGALGLEALSRGAQSCDFIETSTAAHGQISEHLATLEASEQGHCHRRAALDFLQDSPAPYDLVFIDPPFRRDMVQAVCEALGTHGLLAPGALVYIETASEELLPQLPTSWLAHREKISGGVAYRLFRTDQAMMPGDD